ncbi:uncharacterized protein CXQ87_000237 [Candidozyma duobushaemuli]|uniref:RNA helicase n=1 Tax=Candidozyma duobushaemuli TaxID=1231522 RepID=A0A2V1AI24_9ASCO|nr:uncharacterized protein CXQ87_000237 [[Candida] duobushaemulonis]PVH17352.1 hypothetical protein CXQ87_000237 [[Candida] duobushaemulonis]
MSPGPAPAGSDGTGSKKRKRKRSKKSHTESGNSEVDVHTNRVNKKTRFTEEDIELPNGDHSQPLDSSINLDDEVKNSSEEGHVEKPVTSEESVPVKQIIEETSSQSSEDASKAGKNKFEKNSTHKQNKEIKNNANKSKGKRAVFYDDNSDDEDDDGSGFQTHRTTSRAVLKDKAQSLLELRKTLPIYHHKEKITSYVQNNQVVVVIGETGSGKSTQIPQFLIPLNKKRIAVTQPRRVAAASLATRVSEEFGCPLGEEIGYQVRFSNVTSHNTKVNYLTDGMLIRELMLDDKLSKYSTIVIDEAHERTVLTDLTLGFLKQLIVSGRRKDLKVIVMSATLNADLFSKFFDYAPILYVEGRMYPVSKHYLSGSSEDIVDTMVRSVVQINMSEQEGDFLCFLPGQEEIDNCVTILNTLAPSLPKEAPMIVALPLYAALSPGQQIKIFEKLGPRKRKVILATNIAETSITVSGVKYVIDSGLRKVKVWRHQLGLSTLLTTPISQASAKQRAGRAGRESEGKVFRLYSEKLFLNKLPKQQESEIVRNDIILPVLTLKKMGVEDLLNWTWLEHPVLISAFDNGVLQDVIDIVSCLSVENLILNVTGNGDLRDEINYKRRQYCPLGTRSGDLIALNEYFNYYKELSDSKHTSELKAWCKELFFSYKGFKNVMRVRKQITDYMLSTIKQDDSISHTEKDIQLKKLKNQLSSEADHESNEEDDFKSLSKALDIPAILKSFVKGFALNTAIGMPDRSFRTCSTGQLISIHPSSNLFGKANIDAIMYIEFVYTAKAYGRNCSVIELAWLQEVAPNLLGGAKVSINE